MQACMQACTHASRQACTQAGMHARRHACTHARKQASKQASMHARGCDSHSHRLTPKQKNAREPVPWRRRCVLIPNAQPRPNCKCALTRERAHTIEQHGQHFVFSGKTWLRGSLKTQFTCHGICSYPRQKVLVFRCLGAYCVGHEEKKHQSRYE